MGLEAYRIAVKLKEKPKKEDIKIAILNISGSIVEESMYGDISIEVKFEEGFLEILLEDNDEKQAVLNNVSVTEKSNNKNQQSENSRVRIYIRFAKPNSLNLVDRVMQFLQRLDMVYSIDGILDLNSKQKIDLNSYNDFRDRVRLAKEEFEQWFPGIPYPIKCQDVFSVYRELNPDKVKE